MSSAVEQPVGTKSSSPRLTSLDGLRGVAAVIVVFHHALLTVPALATAYYPSQGDIPPGTLLWALAYTPLHLLWAGSEAVSLFFVLSGIVLALPVLRHDRFSWLGYYAKRIVRLYGPVLVAVLLGLLTIIAVARFNDETLGAWVNARPNGYPGDALVRDITLVTGASGVISPLWSLRWEVLFSLALPLYVAFGRAPVPAWLKLVTLVALMAWSSQGNGQYFYYLPMFAIGVLFVMHWEGLADLAERASGRPWVWPSILAVAVVLTCVRWELIAFGVSETRAARQEWVSVLGVSLLVLAAAFYAPLRSALQHRAVQWLGALSFSLYLVHEPIVLAVRFLTADHSPWFSMMISVPLAVIVAVGFARWVERPLQHLARRAGHRIESLRPQARRARKQNGARHAWWRTP